MGYEMTRPAQKWTGIGLLVTAFVLILFTLAVPYINHFGSDEGGKYTYYTRWNGKWKSGQQTTFSDPDLLLDFPGAAPWLIGIGLLISVIGSGYLFWLTYTNKSCYFIREKPGPIGGSVAIFGIIFNFIGNFIYERWASGSPRPLIGWPAASEFDVTTVRISPTFWISIFLGLIIVALGAMNIIYYFDTVSKRPVK
ncbi:MAG: hypothetical protein FK732_09145 [Asgard group archaeon]|nr:hypothetical protein [Asgard group archaeon]